jgi:hypothetical protein
MFGQLRAHLGLLGAAWLCVPSHMNVQGLVTLLCSFLKLITEFAEDRRLGFQCDRFCRACASEKV